MKKISAMVILLAAVAAGCSSGSSSGGSSAVPLMTITGKVSDPAVEGAKVELIDSNKNIYGKCGVNGNSLCNVWSKSDGSFVITLPLGSDISNFSLKSTGGTDTAYGTEITVSYTADINNYAGNYSNIILSPISSLYTNLLLSNTHDNAITILSSYFGLDKNVVLLDPESNGDLLKISYIINQIASNIGSDDAFSKIAALIKSTSQFTTDIDNMLASLFTSNSQLQVSLKEMYQNVSSIQSQDVYTVLSSIQNLEKVRMFKNAYVNIFDGISGQASAEALANIELLYNQLNNKVVIPTSQFQIEQIVRFVASQTVLTSKKLNDYANFNVDAASFQSILTAFINDAALIADIKTLASETVYAVTVPLDSPLGLSDNQKRVDYYFNSTQDVGYQARLITKRVTSDTIIDEIYKDITSTYAKYGLAEKAKKLADVNIADNMARINAVISIARYASGYNLTLAKTYIAEAKQLLDTLKGSGWSDISNDVVDTYVSLVRAYRYAGMVSEANTLKDEIINLIKNSSSLNDSLKQTRYLRIVSHFGNAADDSMIPSLISQGNLELAYSMLQEYKLLIDNTPWNTVNDTYKNNQGMYYVFYLKFASDIVVKDSSYKTKLQSDFATVYNTVKSLIQDNGGIAFLKRTGVAGDAIISAYKFSGETFANEILALITETDKAYPYTIGSLVLEKAKSNGFNTAKIYYETKYPMDSEYARLTETNGYVDTIKNIVEYAQDNSNTVLAKEAVDYLANQTNKAVDYLVANKKTLSKLVHFAVASSNPQGKFVSFYGFNAVADMYIALGYNSEALSVLDKANTYIGSLNPSIDKYIGYILMSYMAQRAGSADKAIQYYNNAVAVELTSGTAQNISDLNIHKASDTLSLNIANKETLYQNYLTKAEEQVPLMDSSSDTNKNKQVSQYTYIANVYYDIANITGMKNILVKAENHAKTIGAAATKLTAMKNIAKKYASYEMIDEGFILAERNYTSSADIFAIAQEMAASVLDSTSIDSDIAFVDTDRDGKPDFFLPNATPEQITASGLTLDDDIDGDGIKDDTDLLPYVANN